MTIEENPIEGAAMTFGHREASTIEQATICDFFDVTRLRAASRSKNDHPATTAITGSSQLHYDSLIEVLARLGPAALAAAACRNADIWELIAGPRCATFWSTALAYR
eukprot:SAG31_NODE_16858_length_692_cov_2.296796_1_plen_106_part_10